MLHIGFENHWNVPHIGKRGMDEDTGGLATFNSTVLDEHFGCWGTRRSMHRLRNMRYPSREQLRKLGQRAKGQPNDQASIDQLLEALETP